MLHINVTSIFVVILLAIGTSSIMINDVASKTPMMFSNWPPIQQSTNGKSPSLRQQIYHHLRTSGRIPSNMFVKRYPSSMLRPMKLQSLKKAPLVTSPSYYKPNIQSPPRYRFRSSPQAPNTGEYVFENPFVNAGIQPNKMKVSLTDDTKYNPIHTIPAPNLNKNLAYSTHTEYVHEPIDNNHLLEKDQYPYPYRPFNIPQYQVTEQLSDAAAREKQKFYAPDPDQSIANYKLAHDASNQQNSIATKTLPIQISFVPAQSQIQAAPVSSPLIHLSNPVPQQQLPDTYAMPIGNQPQLQQHILQQQSMLQGMPVYNPTYLVTQSNNLLKAHHDQLFKPAPAFLGTINQPSMDLSPADAQPLHDVNSVASAGQLIQSQRISAPAQTPTNDFPIALPQSSNGQTFPRYTNIIDKPAPTSMSSIIFGQSTFDHNNNNEIHHQPLLTESEFGNLLNYGKEPLPQNNGFIGTKYFRGQPDPQVEIENVERQKTNDLTIAKANEEQREKIKTTDPPIKSHTNRKQTALEEHQQKLNEQLSGKTSLRIIVPDEDDYEKKNEVRRADSEFYRKETKPTSFFDLEDDTGDDPNGEEEEEEEEMEFASNQYWNDEHNNNNNNNEVTTNADDFFSRDTESVDRLALDGETRDPIGSSTMDSFDF